MSTITIDRERLSKVAHQVGIGAFILSLAYIAASIVSAYVMSILAEHALASQKKVYRESYQSSSFSLGSPPNYRDVEKSIKERNLFNSTGEFPAEGDGAGAGGDRKAAFDINAPCAKPTVNADLVGTIVLDGGGSIATVQEKGYTEADVYREGDQIIGSETAQVVRIERNRLILNNNGVKECLELASEDKRPTGSAVGFPDSPSSSGSTAASAPPASSSDCTLEEKYVQDELGPGFGTIIQKARLVPNTADNQMNGFKIFAIDQSSLLAKTGLQNGDVITQVNDASLKQPEQGFALYQAFQDEKEVRIHILRNGTQPMMITCRIK